MIFVRIVMSTIPLIFNERQIQCIILGNQKESKMRMAKIPMSVVILKSGSNHFVDDFLEKLISFDFEKIIYIEKDNHPTAEAKAKKMRRTAAIVTPILTVAIVAAMVFTNSAKKAKAYEDAVALMNAEQYGEAVAAFRSLGNYQDSKQLLEAATIAKDKAEEEIGLV